MSNVSIQPGKGLRNPGFGGEPLSGSEAPLTGKVIGAPTGVSIRAGNALRWNAFVAGILLSEGITSIGVATCVGLALAVDFSGKVNYQYEGIIELTEAQWQIVTAGGAGLAQGGTYWVDDASPGGLTSTRPTTGGHFATQVGFAISTTQLQLQLSSPIAL